MSYLIVGASKGLGRALAERLAACGKNLVIVASDASELEEQAKDLQIRYSIKVEYAALRVACDQNTLALIKEATGRLDKLEGILFPIGYSRNDDDGCLDAPELERIVSSNLSGIMAITACFLPELISQAKGNLVFFGSVASERGRSSNIAYAAAKRGLQSFYESMRHRLSATDLQVQYYQLGYLKTAQTAGKKLPFPAAEPEAAAKYIVARLNSGSGSCYYPGFWALICFALRLTPWFVFKKLKF